MVRNQKTLVAFGDLTGRGPEASFWVMEMFCTLIGMVVTQVYPFIKRHCTEHLESVRFIMCKLYLSQ